jgi:hypothetical protein
MISLRTLISKSIGCCNTVGRMKDFTNVGNEPSIAAEMCTLKTYWRATCQNDKLLSCGRTIIQHTPAVTDLVCVVRLFQWRYVLIELKQVSDIVMEVDGTGRSYFVVCMNFSNACGSSFSVDRIHF